MISALKISVSILILIVISTILYGLTLRGLWENPTIESIIANINQPTKPNGVAPDRGRFVLTKNLVEKGTFALTEQEAEASSPDVGYYKGNYFIFFGPGISILAVPFYITGAQYNLSQVATFAMGGIFAIADLIIIFLICKQVFKLPYWSSIFASLVFGFGSTSLNYATTLYQHLPTTFLILASFYAAWQYKNHKNWGFLFGFFVWLAYGLAILFDYPNAILMLPVMVYFLVSAVKIQDIAGAIKLSIRPSIFLTSILFIIITAGHLYYNQVNFGSWKSLSSNIVGLKAIQEQHLDQSNLDQSTSALAQKKNTVGAIRENNLVMSGYELLFASDKGLLFFSPIFIFGFLGIIYSVLQKKISAEVGTLIAISVVNLWFYSSWGDPWGGWAFGPRYIIPAMAALSIFIAIWLSQLPRLGLFNRFLALLLFIYSVAVSFVGALTTNAVPPRIEADYIGLKYGYFFNLDMLLKGQSGDFAFNYFFNKNVDFVTYYFILVSSVVVVGFIVLFIMPLFERRKLHES